jgi:hypothetical protein
MIKVLTKLGLEGRYLNIIKVKYDEPIANIILNVWAGLDINARPYLKNNESKRG